MKYYVDVVWPLRLSADDYANLGRHLTIEAGSFDQATDFLSICSQALRVAGLPALDVESISTSKKRGVEYRTMEELARE